MKKPGLLPILLSVIATVFFSFSILQGQPQRNTENPISVDNDTVTVIKGVFDIPELKIAASPAAAVSFSFPESEKVLDYDVSPAGIEVATLVNKDRKECCVRFWHIGSDEISENIQLPEGFSSKAIVWHPNGKVIFVMGLSEGKYCIYRIQKQENKWNLRKIFSTVSQLRRLIVCPRPFIINSDYSNGRSPKEDYTYRLFFGMDNGDMTYRIVSITENGGRFYQVIGPSKTFAKGDKGRIEPSTIESGWALPIAFHPAGHELIWQDRNNIFNVAAYNAKFWGKSKRLSADLINKGTITPTPNGLSLIHWQNDKPGIGVFLFASRKEESQLQNFRFVSTPSSTPDGKGIVGLTLSGNNRYTLNYLPVSVPLADVVNAWMYTGSEEEISLFQKNLGLFRPNQYDQMYKLYDSENYYCGDYDRKSPTRPYLVTTDIFWELFGAAYQGIFIVKERDEAMPDFWKFINAATAYLKNSAKESAWLPVFLTLQDFVEGKMQNPEVKYIIDEKDRKSSLTGALYPFSELKPRGHYTSTPSMQKYFKAFRFFTTIYKGQDSKIKELNALPDSIKRYAEKWIAGYSGFISPSRAPMVWDNLKMNVPVYCRYPLTDMTIFPLPWGFDNEVLFSTVYHPDFPLQKQIQGPGGPRLIPSGLDIASSLGNSFADKLLESDYKKYPPLRKVIEELKKNFNESTGNCQDNLYCQWINAMAVQWADTLPSVNEKDGLNIWQTKRLQTGLATWATLRHATVLVNERTSAECGEGGFEEILMRAPRGYVEPDPQTFGAIAGLFDSAMKYVSKTMMGKGDISESEWDKNKRSLYEGIISRLKETAEEIREFQVMAEKERRGEPLSNEENLKILYIAGTAEHNFLVFNSLSNKNYALSNPDPIGKIADVAGGEKRLPYLMSAVGNVMEWDQIVPFYGRHEIVKGAIYSYYEFISEQILNDTDWRKKSANQEFLPWIKPFITNHNANGRPQTSF